MSMKDDFTHITEDYDNKLFNVYKKVIDEAKAHCKSVRMNAIETFIYVNNKLELSYIELAQVLGIISEEEAHIVACNFRIKRKPPISEKLEERIYDYIDDIIKGVQKIITEKAEDILVSETLDELQQKYGELQSILTNNTISESPYLYERLEITYKGKKKQKYLKSYDDEC